MPSSQVLQLLGDPQEKIGPYPQSWVYLAPPPTQDRLQINFDSRKRLQSAVVYFKNPLRPDLLVPEDLDLATAQEDGTEGHLGPSTILVFHAGTGRHWEISLRQAMVLSFRIQKREAGGEKTRKIGEILRDLGKGTQGVVPSVSVPALPEERTVHEFLDE